MAKVQQISEITPSFAFTEYDFFKDYEESFKKRFEIYTNNLEDVLDYYRNKNLLYIVKSVNPEETFKNLEGVIN